MEILIFLEEDKLKAEKIRKKLKKEFNVIISNDVISTFKVIKMLEPTTVILDTGLKVENIDSYIVEILANAQTSEKEKIPFIFYLTNKDFESFQYNNEFGPLKYTTEILNLSVYELNHGTPLFKFS